MKQVLLQRGCIILEDVPPPSIEDGSVLVEVKYSFISPGTEVAKIEASGRSMLQKALKQPEKIKQVFNTVRTIGVNETIDNIRGKLEFASPIGYSCAGVVTDVGKNIEDIKIGDRVACAGAYANHAEIVCVPRNLVVKIPHELSFKKSASVALGAIAMQGVRRTNPSLGETIIVMGLGLVGQLTAQILKASGCHVIGMDLVKSRVELAQDLGIDYGIIIEEREPIQAVMEYTFGMGADSTIITAATESNLPVQQAMQMTRKKGKVVIVGDVGLNLKRNLFYEKEIDLLISCSYGPGRYDEIYEEHGVDYPYAYVRWTENRNMQEYLRMLVEDKIKLDSMISIEFYVQDAAKAYEALKKDVNRPLGVLLRYDLEETSIKADKPFAERKVIINPKVVKRDDIINVALIGAGNFAQNVHLPNLRKLSNKYKIHAIVTRTGNNSKQLSKRFDAVYCTTDYNEVLQDDNVDMVLIATRHNLHAKIAIEAARAGKAIFLEKPMAINQEELDELIKALEEYKVPFMVGFNRRFSPYSVKAKDIISRRIHPLIINYRVNAGYMPPDNWVNKEEGRGRIIGEACHMFDLLNYFVGSEVENIMVSSINPEIFGASQCDNFAIILKYSDGSLCVLTYTSMGARESGKEYIEIYTDGNTIILDDFKKLVNFGSELSRIESKIAQKGHLEELIKFSEFVMGRAISPISIKEMIDSTRVTFLVDEMIRSKLDGLRKWIN